jgi:hypothetical protein
MHISSTLFFSSRPVFGPSYITDPCECDLTQCGKQVHLNSHYNFKLSFPEGGKIINEVKEK